MLDVGFLHVFTINALLMNSRPIYSKVMQDCKAHLHHSNLYSGSPQEHLRFFFEDIT